ncbi:MAG TPA: SIS domain-containing protein [Beijerinckiaceae bacterium]|jgi:glucosamine--fructose-6-phosphate aminotransferase (isomerizing)
MPGAEHPTTVSSPREGQTHMAREIREAPAAVARQAERLAGPLAELSRCLRARPPQVVVTCARGSSGHAATFGKHLIERRLGIPVAAAAPSIASVYGQPLSLSGQLFVAVSQSGRSDDLLSLAGAAKKGGALTVALVNDEESPLAASSDIVLPLAAGPEVSVAATKTFVASLSALAALTAAWAEDGALRDALARLPERLDAATRLDWSGALDALTPAESLVTIGRGPTLAIAREAALKLKETCSLHAEAFSAAEFLHGPVSLVGDDYPIIAFPPTDEAGPGVARAVADLRAKGASVFSTDAEGGLPGLAPDHPDIDAIALIQSFYVLAEALAGRRGIDVDRPRHLNKVTRTR